MRAIPYIACYIALLMSLSLPSPAAPKRPVEWHIKTAPAKPLRPGQKFNITITGQLDPGWHLYALEEPQGGPIPTEIALTDGDPADLIRVEEAKPKLLPDPVSHQPAGFFDKSADFTLHLQSAKEPSTTGLHILVRYQSCNDQICLPPHTDTIPVPVTIAQ